MAKHGRNQLCHCGSGKKYKRCCWDQDQFPKRKAAEKHRAETYARLDRDGSSRTVRTTALALLAVASRGGRMR